MDIKEKAKQDAVGKALEAMTSAVEQAYSDGYAAGYKDSLYDLEREYKNLIVNGVEYVDLGLPSGTLWSSHLLTDDKNNMRCMIYDEAAKLNIPTKEQFNELRQECELSKIYDKFSSQSLDYCFIGRNGKMINVHNGTIIRGNETWTIDRYLFWLRDNTSADNQRICAYYKENRHFMGDRIPVMLVLSPEQQK